MAVLVIMMPKALALPSSFKASTQLLPGQIVALSSGDGQAVEPATLGNLQAMAGVVVSDKEALLSISTGEDNIQVVTDSQAKTLVSDLNGSIEAGDLVTASQIPGIGQKASDEELVLGTAQQAFNPDHNNWDNFKTVTTSEGEEYRAAVGSIPVLINVERNPAAASEQTYLPGFVQEAANNVAGQEVAPYQVLISLLVLGLSFVSATAIIYATVHSTIISLGRNPLSKHAVYKSYLPTGAVVIVILGVGLALAYLSLTQL